VRQSIAYCPCGNISVDGINFKRVEDAAVPSLQCGACGATSSEFEYVPRDQRDQLLEAIEAHRKAGWIPGDGARFIARTKLYALADQIKSKEGGDASAVRTDQSVRQSTDATRGGSEQVDGVAPETSKFKGTDCGVCGVPDTTMVVVCEGYAVPRCSDHFGSPPYQAEARLDTLLSSEAGS
jgi:hypothetical protein